MSAAPAKPASPTATSAPHFLLLCRVKGIGLGEFRESMSRSAAVAKRVQYAALPYRLMGKSRTEVMLITSLGTRRWIIPKGWPQKGRAPHHSAAREAFEEAGVEGVVHRRSVGSFPYQKRLKNGGVVDCEVEVYALRVLRQSKQWPESAERRVKWVSVKEAAETVQEPKLSTIIRRWAPKSGD
jgi:8-oxo-dGTP pyrophosphatase MutT (NUDIX family)